MFTLYMNSFDRIAEFGDYITEYEKAMRGPTQYAYLLLLFLAYAALFLLFVWVTLIACMTFPVWYPLFVIPHKFWVQIRRVQRAKIIGWEELERLEKSERLRKLKLSRS